MDKIDFVELASFCAKQYKDSHNGYGYSYQHTHFVSITDDNEVKCSITPHILEKAKECILIHESCNMNEYLHKVEFINEDGCVTAGELEGDFSIDIDGICKHNRPSLSLKYGNLVIYWVDKHWADNIPRLWELYTQLRDKTSKSEIKLISKLYSQNDDILKLKKELVDFKFENHLLEQERNQYKELLDEIKEMVGRIV